MAKINPLKIIKETMPQLSKVLESIHAHLERQLETQEAMLEELKVIKITLKELNDKNK